MPKGKMLDVYGGPDPEVDELDYQWNEEWADIEKHADHNQEDHGNRYGYRGQHQPSSDDGVAHDLESVAPDIYQHPEWYFDVKERGAKETWTVLRAIRGKPKAKVTIYRAVPKGVKEINHGDWVTLSRWSADQHGYGGLGKGTKYDILSRTVTADEVRWPGDSIEEFGWFPEGIEKHADHDQRSHGSWADGILPNPSENWLKTRERLRGSLKSKNREDLEERVERADAWENQMYFPGMEPPAAPPLAEYQELSDGKVIVDYDPFDTWEPSTDDMYSDEYAWERGRALFEGEVEIDGETYTIELTDASSKEDYFGGMRWEYQGEIKNTNGEVIGEFDRTLNDQFGTVDNNTFDIFSPWQGKGVGLTALNLWQQELGMARYTEMKLTAANIGQYAWAKYGYEGDVSPAISWFFDRDGEATKIADWGGTEIDRKSDAYKSMVETYGESTMTTLADWYDDISDGGYGPESPYEVAMLGAGTALHVGKEILLNGPQWQGTFYLWNPDDRKIEKRSGRHQSYLRVLREWSIRRPDLVEQDDPRFWASVHTAMSGIEKHETHNQKDHGLWAKGSARAITWADDDSKAVPKTVTIAKVRKSMDESKAVIERFDLIGKRLMDALEEGDVEVDEYDFETIKEWLADFNSVDEDWIHGVSWPDRGGKETVEDWLLELIDMGNEDAKAVYGETPNEAFERFTTILALKDSGMTEAELELALARMQEWVDAANPYVRVDSDDLGEILSWGLMNQYGTGNSNGAFNPDLRQQAEHFMFDYPLDEANEQVPIYGYLDHHPWINTSVGQYGDIAIELKYGVPTTVSIDDSLGAGALTMASSGRIVSTAFMPVPTESIGLSAIGGKSKWLGRMANFERTKSEVDVDIRVGSYMEAQYHAPIGIDSIKAIHVRRSNLDSDAFYVEDLRNIEGSIPIRVWTYTDDGKGMSFISFSEWLEENDRKARES